MNIDKTDFLKIMLGLSFLVLLLVITMTANDNKNNVNNNVNNKPSIENNKNEEDKDTEKEPVKTIYDKLNENNYSFVVNLNINNYEQYITGRVNNETVEVTIDSQTIIRNISEFNNINDNFKYINFDYLKRIIDLASLENKDEENNIITYQVDIIDLIDIYNPLIDYDSFNLTGVDKIVVTLDNGYIKKLEIDYSNYFKYIDNGNNNLNITIEYNY